MWPLISNTTSFAEKKNPEEYALLGVLAFYGFSLLGDETLVVTLLEDSD